MLIQRGGGKSKESIQRDIPTEVGRGESYYCGCSELKILSYFVSEGDGRGGVGSVSSPCVRERYQAKGKGW